MPRTTGFTLVELAAALTVIGILLAVSVPSMQGALLDARRTRTLNAVLHSLNTARVESIRTSAEAVVCPTDGSDQCVNSADNWSRGWMVFVNADADTPPSRDDNERIVTRHAYEGYGTLVANRTHFSYRPHARRATAGTLVYCDRRGPSAARAVIISYTGRPRISSETASGGDLACQG